MNKQTQALIKMKQGSIKITDILMGAGITICFGPVGKISYEFSKLVLTNVQDFIKERDQKRFQEFHATFLAGELESNEMEEFLQKDINSEDYYILLKAAIQDDENQKIRHYAELLRKIALKEVTDEHKLYLMKTVREMTYFEIDLIRNVYIYTNYDLIPAFGPTQKLSTLFLGDGFQTKMAVENLIRMGLLKKEDTDISTTDVTSLAAKSLFSTSELTPDSINRKVWRKNHINTLLPEESGYLLNEVQKSLKNHRFQAGHAQIMGADIIIGNHVSFLIIVIAKTISYKEMDEKMRTIKIPDSVTVVKVIFDVDDFLPSIQADYTVDSLQAFDDLMYKISCEI
jgi:hypothetical protein